MTTTAIGISQIQLVMIPSTDQDRSIAFYEALQKGGLAKKGALIGISRGGLYAYDFTIDVGAYRDLHRHRRCQKFRQAYAGNLGFDTPVLVTESGAGEIYRQAMDAALAAMRRLPAPGAE